MMFFIIEIFMPDIIVGTTSLQSIIQTVLAAIVMLIFVMAIVSFILAIWDFIKSEGEEEAKKK